MGDELINGVIFYPIEPITTVGGSVMHAIKGLDHNLPQFGEVYFSVCDSKRPKAWKKHTRMICNLFVPKGEVKFVFFDDRQDSKDYQQIKEVTLSQQNYGRLVISPGIWFGFSGITESGESLILNVANVPHDPAECLRRDPGTSDIPYSWTFE